MAKRLRVIEEVKTLWDPEKAVSLLNFYYPSKVRIDDQIKPLSRLSELKGNIVIEGIVGQGKSILLRHLAIQEIISNDIQSLPVFIELRTLTPTLSLSQAILAQLSNFDIDIDDTSLSFLCKSGRLSYLLDGFDELDTVLVKETYNELEKLASKYPELQIIVTSRPGNEVQKSTAFRTVRIAPLTTSDFSPFLLKLGLEGIKAAQIKEAIRKSPSKISDLITTPLMLTLVVMVYQSEREIPETLPDFFERLFRVVFTRHDKLKATFNRKHHSGLSERRLQMLFEAFCFMVMQNGFTRSLSVAQFEIAFDQAISYSDDCKCELENFKLDLTKVACLMLDEGIDVTTFLHKSIMEYYAAAFITHSMDEVATLFYTSVLPASRSWWEVLAFLKDIDSYRFSRDFMVPDIKGIQQTVLEPLTMREDKLLVKTLLNLYPELTVRVTSTKEMPDQFEPSRYGPVGGNDCLALKDLDDLLLNLLSNVVSPTFTRSEILQIVRLEKTIPNDLEQYDLTVSMLIQTYGSKRFWQVIDIYEGRLKNQLKEAQKIIDAQQRRKLIFSIK